MSSKPFYLSKTFYVQLFALVALLVPSTSEFIQQNLTESGIVFVVVNIILRALTSDRISIS
jgi:hypothetical protein